MLLLPCQKTVLIQRETVSHSITCSMCAFQGFMHSGFWAGPIFHTHPHLQHSAHCLSKQACTGSVWHLCVRMFYMHLYSVCECSLYLKDISQSMEAEARATLFTFSTVQWRGCRHLPYILLKWNVYRCLRYMSQSSRPCSMSRRALVSAIWKYWLWGTRIVGD